MPPADMGSDLIEVRCHSCARITEIYAADGDVTGDVYTVPEGRRVTCAWCFRKHGESFELEVVR